MSIPNWWGDWRPGLTPHTGNLQSTDLIECTQIVGGQPVNTVITGQQIINAAPGGGGGPQVLGYSGTVGTATSGTLINISKSLLIPANTLTSDSLLELSWRIARVSGNLGQVYSRLYINQTNTLTGASTMSGIVTLNGGGIQQALLAQKSISCSGTSLRYQNTASGTESTASTLLSLTINPALNYYLIWTTQCQNAGDVAAVDQFRVLLYA